MTRVEFDSPKSCSDLAKTGFPKNAVSIDDMQRFAAIALPPACDGRHESLPPVTLEDSRRDKYDSALKTHPGVSAAFKEKIKEWWHSVPEHIRKTAVDAGVKIEVVHDAKQVMPNADKVQARGHAPGENYAMQPGFVLPKTNAVVLVEHRAETPGERAAREKQEAQGVQSYGLPAFEKGIAWHELGHALDRAALHHISQSAEFNRAFEDDVSRIPVDMKPYYHYVIGSTSTQTTPAAKEEVFAELFRVMHCSTTAGAIKVPLESMFPQVMSVLRRLNL